MQQLGFTRSSVRRDHALITPDTHVRSGFGGVQGGACIVHIGPQIGARFTQYSLELEAGGGIRSAPAGHSRYMYVLDGELTTPLGDLAAGHYAYFPPGENALSSAGGARAMVIEKLYVASGFTAPAALKGDLATLPGTPLAGMNEVQVRPTLPDDPAFDFAMNLMTFQPGARLHMVEVHVMEHGLSMLAGEGIYRLGSEWYPVTAGDVIYMAPFCPQWFGALGQTPSTYLLYKDWNRHPAEERG